MLFIKFSDSFHWCCLFLSLSIPPSLPFSLCDGVCGQKEEEGATRSNDAGCISAPPNQMIDHLIKILKTHKRLELYLSNLDAGARSRLMSSDHFGGKRFRHNHFPSFFFCQCHRPFHCAPGKLIYEPIYSLMQTHNYAGNPRAKWKKQIYDTSSLYFENEKER